VPYIQSMKPRKILTIIGTRPEAIKMAPVIRALRKQPDEFRVKILATAQHREMLDQVLEVFRIEPDIDLNLMRANQSLGALTSRALRGIGHCLEAERPDLVLIQGDTTTMMAAALASFYYRIPFAHVEAGLRTGNLYAPYPEELNRQIAGLIARFHFSPTRKAAENLLREGKDPETIVITGNTVIDALLLTISRTKAPPLPFSDKIPYVLMTCHRRENFGQPIREIFSAVRDFFTSHPDIILWYPVHPNPNVKQPAYDILSNLDNIYLTDPLDYPAFCHAMKRSRLILSDSGGVQEEAPALGKPVLVLRDTTERPEGVEAGTCRLVGPHQNRIVSSLEELLFKPDVYSRMAEAVNPYGDGRAAERITAILAGDQVEEWKG